MPDVADNHLMDYWKHQARQDIEQDAHLDMPKGWTWKTGLGGAISGGIGGGISGAVSGVKHGAPIFGAAGAVTGGILGALLGHAAQTVQTKGIEEARGALMQPKSELEKYLKRQASERYMEYQENLAHARAPVTNVHVHGREEPSYV